ncbi:hypothetical protein K7711_45975 [Nocardia sp. CA2R105]|uniref:hypothetical protein n=1 Tax=Nocardia coffeae TaxID=2873381 RepID=UPI001CA71E7F|nr:hypothetical protein [Nocardia coffeae]MBY8863880.1 hypothetical protein [Nocardia coffeae]
MTRTITSLNRILDVLPALADDPRIQVSFTIDEGSEFSVGVADRVRALGARMIPWSDATTTAFDLVIAASDNSDLRELKGSVLLIPHGAGYQKYSPYSAPAAGLDRELSGLAAAALWDRDRPIPARIGLSHGNQLTQLNRAAPELADRAVVIGDPCLDRLSMLARDRDRQRRLLGLREGQALVVVTSTWGPESTMGRWPTLPADLLAQLPYDEFRVAAILHPNVWAYHGSWQIEHWLKRARSAGLILIPPTGPWHSVLAAACCVLGDHGSLSAYAAGLQIPLVLAAFGDAEVAAGTSMAELGAQMPRLDRDQPLSDQIRRAIVEVDRAQLDRLADQVFARRGESLALLQGLMYKMMASTPSALPPVPEPSLTEPLSVPRVRALRAVIESNGDAATIRRLPAALSDLVRHEDLGHLVVTEGEPDERLAQNAAILVADQYMTETAAQEWGTATLSRLPGCRIAAAPVSENTIHAMLRDGRRIRASTRTRAGAHPDPGLLASALHYRLVRTRPSSLDPVAVTLGTTAVMVEFESTQ